MFSSGGKKKNWKMFPKMRPPKIALFSDFWLQKTFLVLRCEAYDDALQTAWFELENILLNTGCPIWIRWILKSYRFFVFGLPFIFMLETCVHLDTPVIKNLFHFFKGSPPDDWDLVFGSKFEKCAQSRARGNPLKNSKNFFIPEIKI